MVFFYDCYLIFKVFINIHEYANDMIYRSDHTKNNLCLSFNLVPSLVFYDKKHLTIDFVVLPTLLRII